MRATGLRLFTGLCLSLTAGVFVNVLVLQDTGHRAARSADQTTADVMWPAHFPSLDQPRSAASAQPQLNPQAPRQLVKAVQRELAMRDYYHGHSDGRLTLLTRAAIMAYEADNGLALTGEASETVLHAILLGAAYQKPKTARPIGPEAKAIIVQVQSLLILAGHTDVDRSGRLDGATQRAIMAFERANRMPPKGRISARLLQRLKAKIKRG